MYEMDYEKSTQLTSKLIEVMIGENLTVAEMTVVADNLRNDLKVKIGNLHIAPGELLSDSVD